MQPQSFENVWQRIVEHQGETFKTKTGLPFTYRVEGDKFLQDRTPWTITIQDFEEAFAHVPIDGPGRIGDLVQGSSYVWAVLHDRRISMGKW